VDWLFDYGRDVGLDVVDDRVHSVNASAYSDADAIRAGNSWYRAFQPAIADERNLHHLRQDHYWPYSASQPLPRQFVRTSRGFN
jgi:hypothetical protein